ESSAAGSARRTRSGGLGGLQGPPHPGDEAGLAPGGGVAVDDALGRGLVDALDGDPEALLDVVGTGLGGLDGPLGPGLDLGAHGPVALTTTEVLPVPLDLALDVRHGAALSLDSCERNSRDRLSARVARCHLGPGPAAGERAGRLSAAGREAGAAAATSGASRPRGGRACSVAGTVPASRAHPSASGGWPSGARTPTAVSRSSSLRPGLTRTGTVRW